MKNLILIIFVLFIKLSEAQNPAEKAVIYVPVRHQPGSEQMPLEYNTQTTRLVQVFETSKNEADSFILDGLQKSMISQEEKHFLSIVQKSDTAYVTISFKIDTDTQVVIRIQDFKGNTIQSFETGNQQDQITVLTRDWVSGLYIAGLYVNGKLIT
jgi:predicted oxidoreductase (fatty acid repression mutant protein)